MSLSALVMGFGAIGNRHVHILNEMDEFSDVSVLSGQTGLSYNTIKSLKDIPDLNPDYVVIASATAQHCMQLKFLDMHLKGRKILVEKPLFDSMVDLTIKHNNVYVGYNLRFHPLLQKIKDAINDRELWNIQVFGGSYIPEWRPGRDYRTTASAKKITGGGVLLDLSHELDYVQWIAGEITPEYVYNKKVSDLEIETDDILLLDGHTNKGAQIHISLNYFTRMPLRQIIIDGESISIQADLITNTLTLHEDGQKSNFSWPHFERNFTYEAEHKALLSGDFNIACTYQEGLEVMRLIDSIRNFKN